MTSMEELIDQQEDTAILIQKAQTNFKKAPKARLTLGYLKVRIQCIDEYWDTFKNTHTSLLKATKREERACLPYFMNESYSECEDNYLSLKSDMQDLINILTSTETSNISMTSEHSRIQGAGASVDVRLPRIDLPKFSGNYEDWQSFEDTFYSLIHNNTALSSVQKLHYLKACLTGEASATLKYYQVTESNYAPALETLKKRYSHKRLIVNTILKRLFMQRKVQAQSPTQLKVFLDITRECLSGLKNLNITTSTWDPVLLFISTQKLDTETHKEWEEHVSSSSSSASLDELPTFKEFLTFLEGRIHTLELTVAIPKPIKERTFHVASTEDKICVFCNKENHTLSHCREFAKLTPTNRSEFVRDKGLCYNCLLPGHPVFYCKLQTSCRICRKRHHSLLHERVKQDVTGNKEQINATEAALYTDVEDEDNILEDKEHEVAISSHFVSKKSTALLATALVPVRNEAGQTTVLRALIDQGSQATLISERATQLLKPKRTQVQGTVKGVGSTTTQINHAVQIELRSRTENNFNINVRAYVMATSVTSQLPNKPIPCETWKHLEGITLADPSFNKPGRIDMLLGVEVYAKILKNDVIKGPPGSPIAQNTSLGWILFGNVDVQKENEQLISLHCLDVDMDDMLKSMWELDENKQRTLTADERLCEEIYRTTHSRDKEGRYIVKLPMKYKEPRATQGETRNIALKRLQQMERRFERNSELHQEYRKVMEEYIELNHMEEVPQRDMDKPAVYLPHHAVVKAEKDTSKTRIVFDASCKGTNNVSLNDDLLVGPPLQEDLRNLIIRWRMKPICLVADVQKMYREVKVTEEDADYQRILWRSNSLDEAKDYRLLRVTFGTSSAPFLAVRTLMQIAEDEGKDFPAEAKTIKEDFFVDDLISGRDNVEEALHAAITITEILQRAGFILKKWSSNSEELLNQLRPQQINSETNIDIKTEGTIKALGLTWNRIKDVLTYQLHLLPPPETITKRKILAEAHRLFDPLGFLAPAIIPVKIVMQKLWRDGVSWDEEVEPERKREWLMIRESLEYVKEVEIERWQHTCEAVAENTTVHGFCDASNKAYAAVAYMRVETAEGNYETSIIAAKSRVAPVKPVSLPRLELCGAVLLSRLLKQVQEATRIPSSRIFAWTDSEIVLSWLFGDPARWNVFVSNRVVEILDNTGNQRWHHVTSENNPADVASRGLMLTELVSNTLWWKGPVWLRKKEIQFTRPKTQTEEQRKIHATQEMDVIPNFEEYDTLQELIRVVTYARRFLNFKRHNDTEKSFTTEELEETLRKIISTVQKIEFTREIDALKENKPVHTTSALRSLTPYLDTENLLRVGGRLRNADIPENTKHPIILGHKNTLVPLLVADAHIKTMHGGIQLMMAYLRARYWIIRVKSIVKLHIHKCLACAKERAAQRTQIMGDLPRARVTPTRPFLHAGVDFAGPLNVSMAKGRGTKCFKAYICIFICMSTKAIHLELVGDLTADAFLGAYRRYVARRGKCSHLWSDHGTNFVAANKELTKLWKEANLEMPDHVKDMLIEEGTQWHFIPPYSPNFGGLWEAGVKSVKYHLKRTLNHNLTFEDMSTTLCQIEACLNSRPLCPIDTVDVDNIEVLTPGHFLIGEAPINVPEPDLCDTNLNRLTRWQLTQRLVQHFWHRWQAEYLTRLQNRPKWQRRSTEYEVGDIVLLKEESLPPAKWALARVVQKHPGQDGACRVYSVKCRGKVIVRSVTKLCELPVNCE
ncbi:uncharacterized protein LOC119693509 [Plutella xylostella]|uniref:uncharacterized protein LOC119693509 n=1 Tax=Plutella xylostella TaxID=51655 RepID=UPI0020323358|nr:uncharacterized protein LOC119693509 [Plutella xylostella]